VGDGVNFQEAMSGRAGVAGARWLVLSGSARKVLRRTLAGLLPDGEPIGAMRLHRAKFKPAGKLTAFYDVQVGGASRPVTVVWSVEGKDKGPDPRAATMLAEAQRAGLAAPFRELEAREPAWGLRVTVFPLDPSHPQLVRLADPAHVAELLAAAWSLGDGARTAYTVTPVRYRPRQRHVLRYDPVGAGETVFAKLYRGEGEAARADRIATRVADRLEGSPSGVVAARPLALLPDDETVLYPLVPGRPLTGLLRRGGEPLAQRLDQAGVALRWLHEGPPELADELEHRPFEAEAADIARAGAHLGVLLPSAAEELAGLLERAGAMHAALEQEPPRFTHSDYKSDHLWIAPDRVTLIDFNTCALADPALDIGKFLADLRWWHAAAGLDPTWAQDRFLDGYGELSGARMARARLYEVLVLAKIAIRRVRVFDADWEVRTSALLGRAVDLLAQLDGYAKKSAESTIR
jgi:hypothetical protein